jgi:hypothetical protein
MKSNSLTDGEFEFSLFLYRWLEIASPISIRCSDTWEDGFIKLRDISLIFERNE